jgi:hypothetical protein
MTRWLLWGLLGLVVVGGAWAAVSFPGGSASDSDEPAGSGSGDRSALTCSKPAAKNAVADSEFEAAVRELGVVQAGEPLFGGSGYLVTEVLCRDLTADGAEEMVARLDCCAGNAPTPWAILSAENGVWRPVFYRTGTQASLSVRGGVTVETSPAYPAGVPTCCPTAGRTSRISWNGTAFEFQSDEASTNRRIRVGSRGVTQVGGFRVRDESPVDAAKEFGTPSYVGPNRELCVVEWRDLGLLINFANLGGVDPCSSDGRVGSIALADEQAAQAGWETDRGIEVGMSVRELREIYPEAKSESVPGLGEILVLIEGRSLVGVAAASPVLSARIADGVVDELRMSVGTSGE